MALRDLETVVLYFGGPWCRCGRPTKEELKNIYHQVQYANGGTEQRLEIIFAQWLGVRPDIRSIPESEWYKCMDDMPWLVLLDEVQSSAVPRCG